MPELPDVEGFRRLYEERARGRRIEAVAVPDPQMLRNRTPQALGRALKGSRFEGSRRHGKWLLAPAGDACVLLHFGMTGSLEWAGPEEERQPRDRVAFVCEGGELRFRDMRRFGGVWLAADEAERDAVTGELGPDAAEVDRAALGELLAGRRGGVKAALMDQSLLAGVGNLLSDEVLWRAGLDPRAPVQGLSRRRIDALHEALAASIRESVRAGRIPQGPRWVASVRDDPEPRCPRCGGRMRKERVGGRSSVRCPRCQRARR